MSSGSGETEGKEKHHDAGPHGGQCRTEKQRAADAGSPPPDPQRAAGGRRGPWSRFCGPLHCVFVNPKTGWIFAIKNTIQNKKKLVQGEKIQNFKIKITQ